MWRLWTNRKGRGNRVCSPTNFTGSIKQRKLTFAILQEKRENLLRITRESALNLGRKVIGDNADVTNIYFIQVEV
jgi:hypothetical protein